ncbi:hypothetical protein PGT21_035594 [Puccinia graminis f. sp. tritici]|uniref:Uncharacterized protein n=2 Tax=Puccinia graminis f. sp. tritici TaxID=56615 RepID=E3L4I0_PUCGT|nr:uncharacterized protein PGTG_17705 [Puccinia graminis f. sp. tritici CRL 75-36-700-3]EFP91455.1 hypothetical protein PGTG_17705 [Puccinia graminis f. sp. tritici CRL 75-36-700-3]KAA1072468.1 hypothetical protein PGT21_034761 [Puccinia graminis f. sp. tritici]KAA1078487.1 hypothetical protein PGT21_035594 [Puccinia graminis f. sp. tritici]KAA1120282.1 hypothetical protein PGTUg99_005568 [Puccinia graminis f. sp. tritici]
MASCTDLQSGSLLEQPNSEEPKLDSKVLRLMITADIPHREEGIHESSFIECMDYSITSFELDPRVQKANSKLTEPLGTLPSATKIPATASRQISRGFGSFVRKLSLRAPPRRDLSLSAPSELLQLQPGSQNPAFGNAVNLSRKKSAKGARLISPLVIDSGKNESWRVGFGKKNFTPSCSINTAVSPISSLCSSTSGSSTHSKIFNTRQAKQDVSAEAGLARPMVQRSSSTTQIHIPPSISLRSMSKNSAMISDQTFEVLSRSNFTRSKTSSLRHESLNDKHLTSTSFSMFSNSTPLPTNTGNTTNEA